MTSLNIRPGHWTRFSPGHARYRQCETPRHFLTRLVHALLDPRSRPSTKVPFLNGGTLVALSSIIRTCTSIPGTYVIANAGPRGTHMVPGRCVVALYVLCSAGFAAGRENDEGVRVA